jgi:DNA-directed RNA polymerase subunit RPC12/RpoP
MKLVECTRCGSTELTEIDGSVNCDYCQSKYLIQDEDLVTRETTIGVHADIQALLEKCKSDPNNRRRYASLILDIDPTNQQANQYLR